MSTPQWSLHQLGWSPFFSQSLNLDELTRSEPMRVTDVHRSRFDALGESGPHSIATPAGILAADDLPLTAGDWVLVERSARRLDRILPRRSLIARRASGTAGQTQPIAANVDTLFVVTSCNADFNPSRLERYFTIAREAHVPAVVLLTKSDLCADAEEYVSSVWRIDADLDVLALDATSATAVALLDPWLETGQTVAFVGSSGVGKSTLVNTLLRTAAQSTAAIREDDARGRHTTTSRRLVALPQGALVIDTPGMRELAIGPVSEATMDAVFDDLAAIARDCRYRDCQHRGDAGCALEAAVAAGTLDPRRYGNYLKLQDEARRASRSKAEQRTVERSFGRVAREAIQTKRRQRDA